MLFNFGIAAVFGAAVCTLATAGKARQSAGNTFYKGHDLSSLGLLESNGATFIDSQRGNAVRPLEDILGDGGMNSVRLRYACYPDPVTIS
jgi:arabinogalactan endo-1,4-beta-galactosidase